MQIENIVKDVTKDIAPASTTDIRSGYNTRGGLGGYGGYGRSGEFGGHRVATGIYGHGQAAHNQNYGGYGHGYGHGYGNGYGNHNDRYGVGFELGRGHGAGYGGYGYGHGW